MVVLVATWVAPFVGDVLVTDGAPSGSFGVTKTGNSLEVHWEGSVMLSRRTPVELAAQKYTVPLAGGSVSCLAGGLQVLKFDTFRTEPSGWRQRRTGPGLIVTRSSFLVHWFRFDT